MIDHAMHLGSRVTEIVVCGLSRMFRVIDMPYQVRRKPERARVRVVAITEDVEQAGSDNLIRTSQARS